MNEVLKIEVQAQVQQAQQALKQLQLSLKGTEQASNATAKALPKLGNSSNQATFALTNFSRVVQDAPFGIIGIANNIDPLIQSFTALKASTGSARAAFAALGSSLLGPAGIAIGISAVTSLLTVYAQSQQGANKQTKESVDLFEQAAGNYSKTAIEANVLVNALKSGELTLEQTRKAQNELIKISPDFKAAFSGPITDINKLDEALNSLNQRILNNIKATAAQNILQKEFDKLSSELVQRNTFRSRFPNLGQLDQNAAFKPLRDKYNKETKQLEIDINNFGQRIADVFKFLDVSYSDFVDSITNNTGKASGTIEKTLKLTDLLNRSGVIIQENENLKEQIRLLDEINSLIQLQGATDRLRSTGEGKSELQSLLLTPEEVAAQKELYDEILRKQEQLRQFQDASRALLQGYTSDITDFLTNIGKEGENAFARLADAIAETTKRILIQFAVTQALTALLNSIAPGAGSLVGGFQGGFGTVLRGDNVRLLFGRTGP